MSSAINFEAAESSGTQGFEQSDRNPVVNDPVGEANGGQIAAPTSFHSRVTQPGPAPSANAGLVDYNIGDSADAVEDEEEREG